MQAGQARQLVGGGTLRQIAAAMHDAAIMAAMPRKQGMCAARHVPCWCVRVPAGSATLPPADPSQHLPAAPRSAHSNPAPPQTQCGGPSCVHVGCAFGGGCCKLSEPKHLISWSSEPAGKPSTGGVPSLSAAHAAASEAPPPPNHPPRTRAWRTHLLMRGLPGLAVSHSLTDMS
jgi:hypothetical protein